MTGDTVPFKVKEPLTGTNFDFDNIGDLAKTFAGGTVAITLLAIMVVVGAGVLAPRALEFIPGAGGSATIGGGVRIQ